jgi:hypothetical protein
LKYGCSEKWQYLLTDSKVAAKLYLLNTHNNKAVIPLLYMRPVAFLCFGTRGDVQPVALVAKLYALRGNAG